MIGVGVVGQMGFYSFNLFVPQIAQRLYTTDNIQIGLIAVCYSLKNGDAFTSSHQQLRILWMVLTQKTIVSHQLGSRSRRNRCWLHLEVCKAQPDSDHPRLHNACFMDWFDGLDQREQNALDPCSKSLTPFFAHYLNCFWSNCLALPEHHAGWYQHRLAPAACLDKLRVDSSHERHWPRPRLLWIMP